MSVRVL